MYTYGSEIWGSFPAQKLLTQGDNYFSKVCRDLIAEKAHIKLCKYSIKVGKKATNSTVMGELGRWKISPLSGSSSKHDKILGPLI